MLDNKLFDVKIVITQIIDRESHYIKMTWNDIKNFFSNPITTFIIGIAVTIMVGVYFYQKSKNIRKPRYYIKSNNLVTDFSNKLDKLRLFYVEKSIKNLTVSKIAFWNDGTQTIDFKNVIEQEALRIECVGDYEILDAKIIKESNNNVNKFSLETVNNKQVRIKFNILDKGQGVAIQIIHTGKGSADIKLGGYIEGAGKPQLSFSKDIVSRFIDKILAPQKQAQNAKPPPARVRRTMGIFSLVIAFIMIVATVVSTLSISSIIFGVIALLIYIYIGYLGLKRRVPKDLEIIEEEDSYS